MTKFILVLLLSLIACGKPINDKTDQSYKSPLLAGVSEENLLSMSVFLNFHLLPLRGEIKNRKKLWSGNSWQLIKGAINYRWNSPKKETIGYLSPSRREIFSMPQWKLEELSPSEKYDLYMGRYDYPLKNEVEWIARQATMEWEGLCHGWAGASLNHAEPGPKVMVNPDGLEIPFGSSDVKALLSYAYSKIILNENELLGKRCEEKIIIQDHCDNDLTAMSFHAILANFLGLRGKSFVADLDRYKEVWNYPILSYESKILSLTKTSSGKTAIIRTSFDYLDVMEKNSWEIRPNSSIVSKMTVEYELFLNKEGNMVGSKWLSRNRPDFIWIIPTREKFKGYLSGVHDLLK